MSNKVAEFSLSLKNLKKFFYIILTPLYIKRKAEPLRLLDGIKIMKHTIFLFGEAERGSFCTPLLFKSLEELVDHLGNPPHTSMGIPYAVQALMYQRELIFFRVEEEGYSYNDYKKGIELLKELKEVHPLSAICMPGVADESLIEAASLVCMKNKSMLIVDGSDLYDYLTLR